MRRWAGNSPRSLGEKRPTTACGSASRASLLTGLHCQQVGHSGTHWNQPTDFRKCVSVGEVLQTAGYRTLLVGKWQERDLPAKRGFDRFFGPMCQGKISYFHEVQLNPFYLDDQRWQFPAEGFAMTDAFTDHAVRFVEEATAGGGVKPGAPFFLYLAYIALRAAVDDPQAKAKRSAVLGAVAAIQVPLVYFSVNLFRTLHQTQTVRPDGMTMSPEMRPAFYVNLLAFTLLYIALVNARIFVAKAEEASRPAESVAAEAVVPPKLDEVSDV